MSTTRSLCADMMEVREEEQRRAVRRQQNACHRHCLLPLRGSEGLGRHSIALRPARVRAPRSPVTRLPSPHMHTQDAANGISLHTTYTT